MKGSRWIDADLAIVIWTRSVPAGPDRLGGLDATSRELRSWRSVLVFSDTLGLVLVSGEG